MRDEKVVAVHEARIRTVDQLRGDRVAPLDCCYRNEFRDYHSADYILVGLEADSENIAMFCEELVDGCRMVRNKHSCFIIE